MGYTHYWKPKHTITEFSDKDWQSLREVAKKVFTKCTNRGISIVFDCDISKSRPHINKNYIGFNGLGNLGHETFILQKRITNFTFCKTARKPYDIAVIAVLIYANYLNPDLNISSDGNLTDWQAGYDLLSSIVEEIIPYPNL